METAAAAASKFLFLFLVCFSGVVLSPVKARKQQDLLIRSTKHDITSFPPTTTVPTDTSTQTIITVPSTTPGTPPPSTPSTTPITNPTNPVTTPGTNYPDPGSPPVTNPGTNYPDPGSPPVTNPGTNYPDPGSPPVTNPGTNYPDPGSPPVTNPGTNYPDPGSPPVTNPGTNYPNPGSPVTNPAAPTGNVPTGGVPPTNPGVTPPAAANNGPAAPGQSWCVVKSGAPDKAVQTALDYACGIGGVDCSAIQQGASCYNPNTLQNHASFAFNSYYQKNPVKTSCDFGGNAVVTNVNPSSGSCIFQTSSTSSPTMGPPSTSSSSGATPTGSGTPPTILNGSYPDAGGANPGFGESPTSATMSSASMWQPFIGCIVMVISAITGRIVLDM